jgi:Protein of unknown function (DUF2934)
MSQTTVELLQKEQIERRAYELYLESGCIDGRDLENWYAAEEELRKKCENRDPLVQKPAVVAHRGNGRGRLSKSTAN